MGIVKGDTPMYNNYSAGAGGFTVSYRRKWTHPVFRNLLEAGIWAWLCDTAVWEPDGRQVRFAGKLYNLQRGQLVTSQRFIAQGFKTTERLTRTLLTVLQNSAMIDVQSDAHGTIITICNYDKYQSYAQPVDAQNDARPTHARRTSDANINNKHHNNVTTSPLTPQGVRLVDKGDEGGNVPEREHLTEKKVQAAQNVTDREQTANYDVQRHLTDKDLEGVREAAPGWCKYALMNAYNENIRTGAMQAPKHPAKAFLAWCRKYTKGERPA